jgi:hypothetical protein
MFSVVYDLLAGLPAARHVNTKHNSVFSQQDSRISAWRSAAESARPPRALRYPFPLDAIPTVPEMGITIPRKGQ